VSQEKGGGDDDNNSRGWSMLERLQASQTLPQKKYLKRPMDDGNNEGKNEGNNNALLASLAHERQRRRLHQTENEHEKHAHLESFRLFALPGASSLTTGSFTFRDDALWRNPSTPPVLAVAMNYLVHLEYFDRHCAPFRNARRRLVVAPNPQLPNDNKTFWLVPKMPDQYGCHHTKALFLFSDTGVRIVVHTANYRQGDCERKVQGAFVQDFPRRRKEETAAASSAAEDTFGTTLVAYCRELDKVLTHHDNGSRRGTAALPSGTFLGEPDLASLIARHDFTAARADLTASCPGRHTGPNIQRWGSKAVRRLLRLRAPAGKTKASGTANDDPWAPSAPIVMQCSSLGSISEKMLSSIEADLRGGDASSSGSGTSAPHPSRLSLVWPRVHEVAQCREGWFGGESIPGRKANVERSHLTNRLCQFSDVASAASRPAIPHIKTYCRASRDGSRLAWVWLTSANLSGAALGAEEKKGEQVFIRHFEMGVLFTSSRAQAHASMLAAGDARATYRADVASNPQRLGGGAVSQSCTMVPAQYASSRLPQGDVLVVSVPLPFPLPPRPYLTTDKPWYVDGAASGRDRNGHTIEEAFAYYEQNGNIP